MTIQQNGTGTASTPQAGLTVAHKPRETASVIVLTTSKAPPITIIQSLLQKQLPAGVQMLGIGDKLQAFSHLTGEQWTSVDIVLKWGGKEPIDQVQVTACSGHYY